MDTSTTIYLFARVTLIVVAVAALIWTYRRTSRVATLGYVLYLILAFPVSFASRIYLVDIVADESPWRWLGATIGRRAVHYEQLYTIGGQFIRTTLLVWLILSLVNWAEKGNGNRHP